MLPVICCRSRSDGKTSRLDEMLLALAAPFRRTEAPPRFNTTAADAKEDQKEDQKEREFVGMDAVLQTTSPSTLDRQASVVAPLTPDNVALLDQAPAAVQTKGPVSDSDGRSATSSKRSARSALERMVDMQATGLQGAPLPTSGFGFGAGRTTGALKTWEDDDIGEDGIVLELDGKSPHLRTELAKLEVD